MHLCRCAGGDAQKHNPSCPSISDSACRNHCGRVDNHEGVRTSELWPQLSHGTWCTVLGVGFFALRYVCTDQYTCRCVSNEIEKNIY